MECFVERLESILKEKGITKTELANKIGIRRPTLSEWKKNGAIPAGDVCVKIARYLDVDVEYLITGNHKDNVEEKEAVEDKTPLFISTLKTLQTEINFTFQTAINALKK